ncbi:hypothetical protein KW783_01280 [Candidatus Parcubacteria bacterium]|nr:hypothetical protein [Candidatus Parcubacteria bacterium]
MKNHPSYFAIFDIGSGSVSVGLTEIVFGKTPKIIYTARESLFSGEPPTARKLAADMLKALNTLCETLLKQLHEKTAEMPSRIENVYCVFSSPWYVSQTKILKIEKKDPVSLSKSQLDHFLEDEHAKFEKSAKENPVTGTSKVIERRIIQTSLNGYPTRNPYGKKARHIDISMFMSLASAEILSSIRDIVEKNFHGATVSFGTFPLISFTAVSDIFASDNNYLLIDLSGEVTEVTLVKNDILMETASFPLGKNELIRKVVKAVGAEPEIAESYLKLYAQNKSDEKLTTKLDIVMVDFKRDWQRQLFTCLKHFSEHAALPNRVFMTIDESLSELFSDIITHAVSSDVTFSAPQFSVVAMDSEKLAHFCEFKDSAYHNPFLAIESVFVHKLAHLN